MTKQFYNTDLFIYAKGLICCSACVPFDMPKIIVEEFANIQNPTGVTPWKISKSKTFADGTPQPIKCEKYPKEKRLHYLLNC